MINNDIGINILLVEDNEAECRLIYESFKSQNITQKVNTVKNGVEALSYLRKEGKYKDYLNPDIILLDLNMPGLNGLEVLKILKQDDNLKLIPVIILSSSRAEIDIKKAYSLGANSYITKPKDFDELLILSKNIINYWFDSVQSYH